VHLVIVLAVLEILAKPVADFKSLICGYGHLPEIEQAMNVGSEQ
jgi:hypothetical protein